MSNKLIDTKKKIMTETEALEISAANPVKGLTKTNDGHTKTDITNFEKILREDPYLTGKIRYNALACRITIRDVFWESDEHPIKDVDITFLRVYITKIYEIDSKSKVEAAAEMVAHQNAYHPIVDILEGLVWDGVPRLENLFPRYLGAERSELTKAMTELLFFGLIQRVLHPGIKYDNCIVLVDQKQGSGKSSICRLLALKDDFFTDGLAGMDDPKKAGELIKGKWICEIGEMLATKKTKDIESIKSFLSKTFDSYRASYARYAEDYPRQTVFIGTTNNLYGLPDDKTGNRRFFPLLCDYRKAEVHPLADEKETVRYILQCYAEAMIIGKQNGFPLDLEKKYLDEIEEIRANATPEDTRVGMIQEWLDMTREKYVCTRMIYKAVFTEGSSREPQRYELADIAEIMNTSIIGWEKYKGLNGLSQNAQYRFETYGRQRAWVRIQKEDFVPVSVTEVPFLDKGTI